MLDYAQISSGHFNYLKLIRFSEKYFFKFLLNISLLSQFLMLDGNSFHEYQFK